jgi:hypothetical protein
VDFGSISRNRRVPELAGVIRSRAVIEFREWYCVQRKGCCKESRWRVAEWVEGALVFLFAWLVIYDLSEIRRLLRQIHEELIQLRGNSDQDTGVLVAISQDTNAIKGTRS